MSAGPVAYTIVGSLLFESDLYDEVEHDVHESCEALGPGPLCSSCGQPLGQVSFERVPIAGYDVDISGWSAGAIDGIDLIRVAKDPGELVLPVVQSSAGEDDGGVLMEPLDLDEARETNRRILEPMGLWAPDRFGVWTALEP